MLSAGRAYIVIGFIVVVLSVLSSCGSFSTKKEVEDVVDSIAYFRNEGLKALNVSDFSKATDCGAALLKIAASSQDDDKSTAAIYGRVIMGQANIFITDSLPNAYPYLSEAEQLAVSEKNYRALVSTYNGLGIYMLNVDNDLHGAMQFFFKGLDISKEHGFDDMYSLILNNIAVTYYLKKNPVGLHYAEECYYYGKDNDNDYCVFIGAKVMSYFLRISGQYEQALRYLSEAEMLIHSCGYENELTAINCIYAEVYFDMGDHETADSYYRRAFDCPNRVDDDLNLMLSYSRFLIGDNKNRQAISILDSALVLTDNSGYEVYRPGILQNLTEAYSNIGDIKRALRYSTVYGEEISAANERDSEKSISDSRLRYDYERSENALMRQKLDLMKKQRIMNWLFSVILIIICILVAMYLLYRRKSMLYAAIVRQSAEAVRNESSLRQRIRDLEESRPNVVTDEDCSDEPTDGDRALSSMSDEKLRELVSRFESLMLDTRVYTDNDINKDKVARLIGTNRTYLSRMINEHYKMSFTQLINSMRIKEAIRRLSDVSDDTPLKTLSLELGFNSISTFYTQFNSEVGITPAAFRSKVRHMGGF